MRRYIQLVLALIGAQVTASESVDALIQRMVPAQAETFVTGALEKEGSHFEIRSGEDGKILLLGSTPVAEASAFGWYIKHVAKGHFSWSGANIPSVLPPVKEPIVRQSPYRKRFAHNYCALSYTAAFWDWPRWEQELDFLASNGMNQQLIIAGLEEVWRRTLLEVGYPEAKIQKFISDPAYAAWWHMGNLEGEGGVVSNEVIRRQADLGRKIFSRCEELGIEPVLQGFVGLLPHDIGDHVKGLPLIPQGTWVAGYVRPIVLDPTSKQFEELAAIWYRHLHDVYGGKGAAYAGDLFHEGGHKGNVALKPAAESVQRAMQKASPGSAWVLMNWQANPPPQIIAGTDPKLTQILQLCRNMKDGNNGSPLRNFQGRPWLWGELANFGGNHNLYGGNPLLARLPELLETERARGDVAGVALLSEGFETNPIYYDLFFDMIWRDQGVDLSSWTASYVERRYGAKHDSAVEAWNLLNQSIYSPTGVQEGCTESILCAKPSRNARKASSWSTGKVYYDPLVVADAAEKLILAASEMQRERTMNYDLVDVVRQVMADLARPLLQRTFDAYDAKDTDKFKELSELYLQLILDTDRLLSTHEDWLLASWTMPAERMVGAHSLANAKRLITKWSSKTDALDGYSHRQFAGLMKDYHHARWKSFFDLHVKVLEGKLQGSETNHWYAKRQAQQDLNYISSGKTYSLETEGDSLELARAFYQKYAPLLKAYAKHDRQNGYAWKLSKKEEVFEFDVNESFMEEGAYEVIFQWEAGQSALKIHSVELFEGEKKLIQDKHEGWTGIENKKNTYLLELKKLRTNLDTYRLKVSVSGASGADSSGLMTIKKVK